MKKLQKITLTFLTATLMMCLAACNTTASEANATKKDKEVNKQEAAAKTEFEELFASLLSQKEEGEKEKGYMSSEDYSAFKREFDLLSNAIESKAQFDMNSTEDINNAVLILEDDVNSLEGTQALEASKRYSSEEFIYEVAIMEELHILLERFDVHYTENPLNNFVVKYSNSDSYTMESINEEATSVIETYSSPYGGYFSSLNSLKTDIKSKEDKLDEQNLSILNSVILNLEKSLQNQVRSLNQFQTYVIEDDRSFNEVFNEAQQNISDAEKLVDQLEEKYDIDYDDYKYN